MRFDWKELEALGRVDGLISRGTFLDVVEYAKELEAERDARRRTTNPGCPCPDSCHAVQRCYGGCLAKRKD